MDFAGVFIGTLFSTNNLIMVADDGSASKDYLAGIVSDRKRLVLLDGRSSGLLKGADFKQSFSWC